MTSQIRIGFVLLLTSIVGCGSGSSTSTIDSGSREVVRRFDEALIQKNWPEAYALLHPESVRSLTQAEFTRRAEQYRRGWGFEATRVAIRTCEEHGETASARVTFHGPGTHRHQYEDNVFLKRHQDQWRIVLSPKFGGR